MMLVVVLPCFLLAVKALQTYTGATIQVCGPRSFCNLGCFIRHSSCGRARYAIGSAYMPPFAWDLQIDQTLDPCRVSISGAPYSLSLAVSMVTDIIRGGFTKVSRPPCCFIIGLAPALAHTAGSSLLPYCLMMIRIVQGIRSAEAGYSARWRPWWGVPACNGGATPSVCSRLWPHTSIAGEQYLVAAAMEKRQ